MVWHREGDGPVVVSRHQWPAFTGNVAERMGSEVDRQTVRLQPPAEIIWALEALGDHPTQPVVITGQRGDRDQRAPSPLLHRRLLQPILMTRIGAGHERGKGIPPSGGETGAEPLRSVCARYDRAWLA